MFHQRILPGLQAMFHRKTLCAVTRAPWTLVGLSLLAPLGTPELHAQGRDFLLSTPKATLSLRAGLAAPRAGGGNAGTNLWDDLRDRFTVGTADLNGTYLAAELGIRASEHADIVLGVGHTSSATQSQYRRWRDEDDVPITQTTEFTTTPLTVGLKVYLLPRGRAVGRYAWIPRTWNPYAGTAAGIVRYRFEQYGHFVDYQTRDIFEDRLRSAKTGSTVHFFAGVDGTGEVPSTTATTTADGATVGTGTLAGIPAPTPRSWSPWTRSGAPAWDG